MNTAKTLLAIALTTACASAMAAEQVGAVYASSNKAEGNTIVAFKQMSDGSLSTLGEFKSGGKGTGNIEIFDGGYDPTHPLADGIDPLISAYGVYNTEDKKH
ncbi:MAG TPA: 3-carboxymuconate cyclase, partial [Pseudomonas sp.]|nr:3-carboxymuconate cyclase [Pseudomonas sp.]